MNPDFADAAERHWDDAHCLFQDDRFANADHLLGLSAECSLKAIMLGLGMQLNETTGAPVERKYRVHIDKLWDEFQTFATNRDGARYAAILRNDWAPFDDWSVNDRYASRSDIRQERVWVHNSGAGYARICLQTAWLDGVL
ncbi:MAG: hypothetical protein U5L98_16450 [Halomonas sp.]|uniref:hypothetical protein n=1 Tax=Halomonas sp. TaxID=1486246 RepID=UPI002ACEE676|nr:hypothetical protein [Halomonas sp.]MDZ7854174.1 hypothetical protein [Halomonas sp.]